MSPTKRNRVIRNNAGRTVACKTTSVNLEQKQVDFLKANNINLSGFIRKAVDALMVKKGA